MRVEDLQAAHQQHGQRDYVDPVGHADHERMPLIEILVHRGCGLFERQTAGIPSKTASSEAGAWRDSVRLMTA
jgi:hypothetical protein